MFTGNLVSILAGGSMHALFSFLSPQNYNWSSTNHITMVDIDSSDIPKEEYSEAKLKHTYNWIIKLK